MVTLQGSWIVNPDNSHFFLWGERWKSQAAVEVARKSRQTPQYPFALNREEFETFSQSQRATWARWLRLEEGDKHWGTQAIAFPSQPVDIEPQKRSAKSKQRIVPLLSGELEAIADFDSLSLQGWQVEGICLTAEETALFLQSLPLGSLQDPQTHLGASLRFWTQAYRWSLDLLARSKFLPGIAKQPKGKMRACWEPLLDSAVDRARLNQFSQSMPSVCRAYSTVLEGESREDSWPDPQALLLQFLSSLANAQLPTWLETNPKPSRPSLVQPWLQALTQSGGEIEGEPEPLQRLETALLTWTLPVRDYLVTPTSQTIGGNQFGVCFQLEPPTEGEIRWGKLDWKLNYYLRSVSNPNVLVDAEAIWQNPVDELVYQGQAIENPQETLLKGLGLATRLYAPVEASLDRRQPTHCLLNPIEVYEFIRAIAAQLQNSGFGVILPPGLASGTEKRLGVRIAAKVARKKGDRLTLKSPLSYKLELAVGDRALSQEDFERLLDQRSPLVEIDGEWMALQPADVRAAQAILASSEDLMALAVEDALRFSAGDTKTFAKLPITAFEPSGVLKELIVNLTENKAIDAISPPKDFRGELRPYQIRGVSWLAFLERWSLGACLADDMGLGKTPQLLALILHLKEQKRLQKPSLVVCPTSVLGNWEREVKRFAPTLSVLVHHGDKRAKGKNLAKAVKGKDLAITSYSLVFRDAKALAAIDWEGVVLDEAQNIKNPQAKQSQAVRSLPSGFRVALTGTPVENRLSELWSILDFLNPGFLGTQQFFQRRFALPIEKYGDRDSLYALRSLVQPFILRRLKTDKAIIQDLPEKQEMNVFCGLSTEQAQLYQQLADESLQKIEAAKGIQRHGLILTLLVKLKQVCNHPAHYLKEKRMGSAERSGKLLRLQEMLEEIMDEGDACGSAKAGRALIFTQFAEWGKLLQPYLEKYLKREVLFLYGSTRRDRREEIIDRFQNDPQGPRILILSLKAGGTGLNLTRANHVFHIDRWWNPAVENQATDRAFRIGQKRNVQVHKFVCTGTLEERISDIIESKKQLAEQTIDAGEQWLTKMDTDQLRNLLLLDRDAVIDD